MPQKDKSRKRADNETAGTDRQVESAKQTRRTPLRTLITKLLAKVERDLEHGTANKVSVADFIRLLQLKREIDGETKPRLIEVTWVETLPASNESVEG